MSQKHNPAVISGVTLLGVADAARRLDVTADWVRKLCRRGSLPGAALVGQTWVIPQEALDEFQRRGPLPRGRPSKARRQPPRTEQGTRVLR